jgi:hypothetical protein
MVSQRTLTFPKGPSELDEANPSETWRSAHGLVKNKHGREQKPRDIGHIRLWFSPRAWEQASLARDQNG